MYNLHTDDLEQLNLCTQPVWFWSRCASVLGIGGRRFRGGGCRVAERRRGSRGGDRGVVGVGVAKRRRGSIGWGSGGRRGGSRRKA